MRNLAHIEQITDIRPIEGSDFVCQATVLGWNLVVKKNEFKDGDKCVYIEIDSVADKNNPAFEFLKDRNYKIKTLKIRGVLSQGIALPMSILPKPAKSYKVGEDVTRVLKITQIGDEISDNALKPKPKYRKFMQTKFAKKLMKTPLKHLINKIVLQKKHELVVPGWISTANEVRLQNNPDILNKYKDQYMIVTEKLDGTSASYALKTNYKGDKEFIVSSKGVRQATETEKTFDGKNPYWEMAFKYKIKDILADISERFSAKTVTLQGEIVGSNIEKNRYNIKGRQLYIFNLVIDGNRFNYLITQSAIAQYGLSTVPILDDKFILKDTVDEMMSYADGDSKISNVIREGVVIRDHHDTVSFKCVSNKYLLKYKL